ncbi:hypothetical protein G6F56_011315 [Rhizopus delemar]|nr:hypothetical protein G6F56_011315 [Rhizopus delemar]
MDQVWYDLCTRAFDNETIANDFVLFVESCKLPKPDGFVWTTDQVNYQSYLEQMGCKLTPEGFYLSNSELAHLSEVKKRARQDWQTRLQQELKACLTHALEQAQPGSFSHTERLSQLKTFIAQTDLGSVPIVSGLKGFLNYQLTHKDRLAEWSLSEYAFTQNGKEHIQPYVNLLKNTFDFKQSQTEDELVWRMNPNLENSELYQLLACIPGHTATTHYRQTETIRFHKQGILDWFYILLFQIRNLF